ncbi:DUF1320 domain-containing protein [Pyruvatibacter sp.]|uniref:gp436 family protein n=1 Tax=Pyruvatibacter sp. TaxID=1981328 RepID=UPI0032EF3644
MTYATKQDLIDRFGAEELEQLTDRDGTADAIVDSVLTRALEDADAKINSYLSGHYTLPLSDPPDVLERTAADMARYYLYQDGAPEQVQKAFDHAIAYLRDVAAGKARLGDQDAPGDAPTSDGGPRINADPAVFSKDTLADY